MASKKKTIAFTNFEDARKWFYRNQVKKMVAKFNADIDKQIENDLDAMNSKKYPPDLTGLMSSMVTAKCTCKNPLRRFDIDGVEYCAICDMNL